jgi:transcription termination factor NusB
MYPYSFIKMNKTEQAILAAWRLQQIQEGDTVNSDQARWIAEAIELLKELGKQ